MAKVEETGIPGVGIRHDFITTEGERIGVVAHHSGERELLIYDTTDPDACREVLRLNEEDTRTLAELLGAAHIVEKFVDLQHSVKGLAVDWLTIEAGSALAGQTLAETRLRELTGVSIVAVGRGEEAIPAPPSDFRLEVGDVALMIGTPGGIRSAAHMLRTS